jgi:beta-phosphoglucomutase-like phosphatase (HAD superfamily)
VTEAAPTNAPSSFQSRPKAGTVEPFAHPIVDRFSSDGAGAQVDGLRALLFDFDGVVIDSEGPAFRSWAELYGSFGVELSPADWSAAIGTVGGFDPIGHLEDLIGHPVDPAAIQRRWQRKVELVATEGLRPGIADLVHEASSLDVRLAIVSSDTAAWVSENLARLDLVGVWAELVTADGDRNRAKPRPHLYLEALNRLDVPAIAVVAIEDSPNGIAAAKAAGLYCLAFANPTTASLDLSAADRRVDSLDGIDVDALATWLKRHNGEQGRTHE